MSQLYLESDYTNYKIFLSNFENGVMSVSSVVWCWPQQAALGSR